MTHLEAKCKSQFVRQVSCSGVLSAHHQPQQPPSLIDPDTGIDDELRTYASRAALLCETPEAFGILDYVVPRMRSIDRLGEPVSPNYFVRHYDTFDELQHEVLVAGLHAYQEDLLRRWTHLTVEACRGLTLRSFREKAATFRPYVAPKTRPLLPLVNLKRHTRPAEAVCGPSRMPGGARTARKSADCSNSVDDLLRMVAEAGTASKWYESLLRDRDQPQQSYRESFFAGIGRPDDKKIQSVTRVWQR